MKHRLCAIAWVTIISLPPMVTHAADSPAQAVTTATAASSPASTSDTATSAPIAMVQGDAVGMELYDDLQHRMKLLRLDKESPGAAIQLRIYHTVHTTAGGTAKGVLSGLFAAGTLGLIPMVISGEHTIHYDLYVNGVVLTRRQYTTNLSHAKRLTAADTTHGLGADGQLWAKSTIDNFLADTAGDQKLAATIAEYHEYFDATQ